MRPHACTHIEQYRCGTGHTRRPPDILSADHISTDRFSSDERLARFARRQMVEFLPRVAIRQYVS
jgi:hypothetical protein